MIPTDEEIQNLVRNEVAHLVQNFFSSSMLVGEVVDAEFPGQDAREYTETVKRVRDEFSRIYAEFIHPERG